MEVVFEIVSEGDDIVAKCRHYQEIGVPQVFVFDPNAKTIAEWNDHQLLPVVDVKLRNGVTITGQTIWFEMGKRLTEKLDPPASKVI